MPATSVICDAVALGAHVEALETQLFQALAGRDVAVVGVRRGGLALSRRIAAGLSRRGLKVDVGSVDIALYRDDGRLTWPRADAGASELAFPIDGRDVVLVDDVFWTGRTARAAMDAVLDYGRPRRLWLATLAVREGRELPITPDVVALSVAAGPHERVVLRFVEDGHPIDELVLVTRDRP